LEQYALTAFGKALQVVPRTLAENAGWNSTRVLADLQAAHAASPDGEICSMGVDIERDGMDDDAVAGCGTASMKEVGVVDLLATKLLAIKLAFDAATTILKVDCGSDYHEQAKWWTSGLKLLLRREGVKSKLVQKKCMYLTKICS
jgi:T-complex protein 1 subunit theta